MKSKTNISIVSNTGVRRKAEVIIGDSGKYSSGDILDANATHSELNTKQDTLISGQNIKTINNISLLGSGNIDIQGGGGGDTPEYPSEDQIVRIVATCQLTFAYETYLDPELSEISTPKIPTYQELKSLISEYNGQVFIDYTIQVANDPAENVEEIHYLLHYACDNGFTEGRDFYLLFEGPEGVSIKVDRYDNILFSPLRVYDGVFECSVEGDVATFDYTFTAINAAVEYEDTVRCIIYNTANNTRYFTTLTKLYAVDSSATQYVFSNDSVKLTIDYSGTGSTQPSTVTFENSEVGPT